MALVMAGVPQKVVLAIRLEIPAPVMQDECQVAGQDANQDAKAHHYQGQEVKSRSGANVEQTHG